MELKERLHEVVEKQVAIHNELIEIAIEAVKSNPEKQGDVSKARIDFNGGWTRVQTVTVVNDKIKVTFELEASNDDEDDEDSEQCYNFENFNDEELISIADHFINVPLSFFK